MKKILLGVMLVVLSCCPAFADQVNEAGYTEGYVLVAVDSAHTSSMAENLAKKFDLEIRGIAVFSDWSMITFYSAHKTTAELIELLSAEPGVISAEPNEVDPPNPKKSSSGCHIGGYGSTSLLLAGLGLWVINGRKAQ